MDILLALLELEKQIFTADCAMTLVTILQMFHDSFVSWFPEGIEDKETQPNREVYL